MPFFFHSFHTFFKDFFSHCIVSYIYFPNNYSIISLLYIVVYVSVSLFLYTYIYKCSFNAVSFNKIIKKSTFSLKPCFIMQPKQQQESGRAYSYEEPYFRCFSKCESGLYVCFSTMLLCSCSGQSPTIQLGSHMSICLHIYT